MRIYNFLQGRRYANLLRPQRTKYRKMQKNIRAVLPAKPDDIPTPTPHFGMYGIYAMESIRLNAEQIEAARMAILKTVGRKELKMWVRVFPHIPVTKKPLEVRMGKGKGSIDRFVAYVKAGKLLYEFNCPSASLAKAAYKQAAHKLPIKVRFVEKETLPLSNIYKSASSSSLM